jgi:hypothetical protein
MHRIISRVVAKSNKLRNKFQVEAVERKLMKNPKKSEAKQERKYCMKHAKCLLAANKETRKWSARCRIRLINL